MNCADHWSWSSDRIVACLRSQARQAQLGLTLHDTLRDKELTLICDVLSLPLSFFVCLFQEMVKELLSWGH
jgi:hypothetical protein